jgi:type I restriction enzyme, S subunit
MRGRQENAESQRGRDAEKSPASAPPRLCDSALKETEIGLLPADWEVLQFAKAIVNRRIRTAKVKKRDYMPSGAFPVVDQGQEFIGGYWDEAKDAYRDELPVIIFGDHTRIFKFIDFPFVRGADGVKVLIPNKNRFDPGFLYFAFMHLDIPNRGYSRHYKLLKERYLPRPQLPEQRRIAAALRTIQDAIAAQDDVIAAARELKRGLMERLFTYGPGREPAPTKETEIGEIPEHWGLKALGELADISSGSTPKRTEPRYWEGGTIPWVKTGEINYDVITTTEERITEDALIETSVNLLPPATLLLAMYGQGVTRGRVAILGIEATTNQACAAIVPRESESLTFRFLYYYLTNSYENLRSVSHGTQQLNLSGRILAAFLTPVLPIKEQDRIIEMLSIADGKIAAEEQRKVALEEVFRSTLEALMTGKTRLVE